MILVIDNYDSFVYSLAQYLGELGWEPLVYRNDSLTLEQIEAMVPSHIVISPGPCTPLEAGISNSVVGHFRGRVPILGVCLGHQCIGYVYGGLIRRARVPMHAKTSAIFHDARTIFNGLAISMIFGILVSTVLTLVVIPVLYYATLYKKFQ